MVDELPLLSRAEPRRDPARARHPAASRRAPAEPAASAVGFGRWLSSESGPGRALRARKRVGRDPLAGPHHAHRPSRGDAGRPRAGVLPQGEPQAAPAQRAPVAARAPVRHRAGRPALGAERARALLRSHRRSARRSRSTSSARSMQQARQSAPARPDDTFAALAARRPCSLMRVDDLVRPAVRRRRRRGGDVRDQRRPGELLLGRLAARPVAQLLRPAAGRYVLPARRRDPGR